MLLLNFISVGGNVVFHLLLAMWRARLGPPWVDQLNVLEPSFSCLFLPCHLLVMRAELCQVKGAKSNYNVCLNSVIPVGY